MYSFCGVIFVLLLLHFSEGTIEVIDRYGRKIDTFPDREAPSDSDFIPVEGFLVSADPPEACTNIAPPSFLTNFTLGRFALINGSEKCSYRSKVYNAEKAGFDAAVIFDSSPSPFGYSHLRIKPFPTFEFNIQVVFISLEDGLVLNNSYLYNNSHHFNYIVRIRPNIPDITYYLYLFASIIGVCFFVMLLFMICLVFKCIQERRKNRRNRLSSRQIRQIPTAKFSKGDQYDVCAICLEQYNEGDKLRILPCSHAYHSKCVDPWLMNNRRNCPLCKRKITFGDSGDESDSEDSELTSPAENTPLLTATATRSQTWGTFAASGPPRLDGSGPSSLPTASVTWPSSGLSTPEETESLLPPPHHSVNHSISIEADTQTRQPGVEADTSDNMNLLV